MFSRTSHEIATIFMRCSAERRPAGELSDDEVSSDVSNQQRATVQPAVGSYSTSRHKQQYIQSRATMNQLLLCIQSQDDVPVASYSGSSRRLQRVATSRQRIQSRAIVDPVAGYSAIAYQSTWNPDARKAEVAKNYNQAQNDKKPAKERTQRTIHVGALQNTFEREDFVFNGLNLNRGLYTRTPLKRGSYSTSRRKQQYIQSRTTMNQLLLCIQSQDDVPVASYSGSSRRLQRVATSRQRIQSRATVDPVVGYSAIAYQSTRNPDARKAEVAKNCNQAQSIQSSKNPVAAVKE
ncbi:UDP-Glycosyltransferase/glycogen phosphorylase [Dorcoceras hygrometricum]|uniref:UDP-Glycosyltransferase/glycogen phosphorylase n=1 Tax=Dorcoceras hygrometricum TaxID=472368 RepID=A0A2Z7CFT8_9LAMI|nr:UDP-Glycosyltransferase/glycogen phosphorylase [Dorcoceras hygrometricum]